MQQTELFKPLQTPNHEENYPKPEIQREKQPTANNGKSLSRTLKIEADGDPWRGKIKSKIRLKGYWLASAGFMPGQRTHVKLIAPGVLELRSNSAVHENHIDLA